MQPLFGAPQLSFGRDAAESDLPGYAFATASWLHQFDADFDTLALSNLNRLSCGVADLGQNKAVVAARRLFEVDPYLEVAEIHRRVIAAGEPDSLLKDQQVRQVYLGEQFRM